MPNNPVVDNPPATDAAATTNDNNAEDSTATTNTTTYDHIEEQMMVDHDDDLPVHSTLDTQAETNTDTESPSHDPVAIIVESQNDAQMVNVAVPPEGSHDVHLNEDDPCDL